MSKSYFKFKLSWRRDASVGGKDAACVEFTKSVDFKQVFHVKRSLGTLIKYEKCGISLKMAGICKDSNSRPAFHSLTLIVGGQSPPPCCCATALHQCFPHTAPVSEKTQDVDKRDHSSSREVVSMNEIPGHQEGSLIRRWAGSLVIVRKPFQINATKAQNRKKTCVLVRRLKTDRKQQTPAGTICHPMSCSQRRGPSLAVL